MIDTISSLIKRFKSESDLKKIAQNISWLYFDSIFQMVIGFTIGIFVCRYLGPENYGKLNYVISFVVVLGVFATFALNDLIVQEIIKLPLKKDRILGTVFFMRLGGATISFAIIVLSLILFRFDSHIKWLIILYSSGLFFQSFTIINYWFESKLDSKKIVTVRMIVLLTTNLFKLFLVLSHANVGWFVLAVTLDFVLFALGILLAYKFDGQTISKWKFDKVIFKRLLHFSWPILAAALFDAIYLKFDRVILGQMMSKDVLGNFSVGTLLSDTWIFIPTAITVSVYPAIIRAKKLSEKLYKNRLEKLLSIIILIAVLIALPLSFFAKDIIQAFYGEAYASAGLVLMIYTWTILPIFLGAASIKWFYLENLQKYLPLKSLFGAITSITLNITLIPVMGVVGTCIAAFATFIVVHYLSNLFFVETRELFKIQSRVLLNPIGILRNKSII